MMNHPGFPAIDADKAQASEDGMIGEVCVKEFFVSEAVLKCENTSAFFQ